MSETRRAQVALPCALLLVLLAGRAEAQTGTVEGGHRVGLARGGRWRGRGRSGSSEQVQLATGWTPALRQTRVVFDRLNVEYEILTRDKVGLRYPQFDVTDVEFAVYTPSIMLGEYVARRVTGQPTDSEMAEFFALKHATF